MARKHRFLRASLSDPTPQQWYEIPERVRSDLSDRNDPPGVPTGEGTGLTASHVHAGTLTHGLVRTDAHSTFGQVKTESGHSKKSI